MERSTPATLDWNDLRYFLAVARAGGLTPAATALGTSASTVSRHIDAMEARLGVRLFLRQQRGYQLTDQGGELFAHVAEVERAMQAVERRSGEGITELHGKPEVIEIAGRAAYLLPLFHPAAALYTRALLDTLRDDVARIPELLALPDLPQPEVVEPAPVQTGPDGAEPELPTAIGPAPDEGASGADDAPAAEAAELPAEPDPGDGPPQLGLF